MLVSAHYFYLQISSSAPVFLCVFYYLQKSLTLEIFAHFCNNSTHAQSLSKIPSVLLCVRLKCMFRRRDYWRWKRVSRRHKSGWRSCRRGAPDAAVACPPSRWPRSPGSPGNTAPAALAAERARHLKREKLFWWNWEKNLQQIHPLIWDITKWEQKRLPDCLAYFPVPFFNIENQRVSVVYQISYIAANGILTRNSFCNFKTSEKI